MEAAGIKITKTYMVPANRSLGESSYKTMYTARPLKPFIAFKSIINNNPQGAKIKKR